MGRRRRGIVSLSGVRVGVLEERDDGITFKYDDEWLRSADAIPISLTLPLTKNPYASKGLHPFFANLLPEGWLLDIASAKLRKSKEDAFGLLLATCSDCVGAVEVHPDTTTPEED